VLLEGGRAKVAVVADTRLSNPTGADVLKNAAECLAGSLKTASGADFPVRSEAGDDAAIIIG